MPITKKSKKPVARRPQKTTARPETTKTTLSRDEWLATALPSIIKIVAKEGQMLGFSRTHGTAVLTASRPPRVRNGNFWVVRSDGGMAVLHIDPVFSKKPDAIVLAMRAVAEWMFPHRGDAIIENIPPEVLKGCVDEIGRGLGHYPTGAHAIKKTPSKSACRQRKYVCKKCGQILRAATDSLDAIHKPCNAPFILD